MSEDKLQWKNLYTSHYFIHEITINNINYAATGEKLRK